MTPTGKKQLIADEGKRLFVYDDATGAPLKPGDKLIGWPSVGIGRNLAARGLTDGECDYLFDNDIGSMWAELNSMLPWLTNLDAVRCDVVLMVEFNTGNVFAFRNMLAALSKRDWKTASAELLNSKAATQGVARYKRMAEALLSGSWEPAVHNPNSPIPE